MRSAALVTGNSIFSADCSEISGRCPPHSFSAREDPRVHQVSSAALTTLAIMPRNIILEAASVSLFRRRTEKCLTLRNNLTALSRAECPLCPRCYRVGAFPQFDVLRQQPTLASFRHARSSQAVRPPSEVLRSAERVTILEIGNAKLRIQLTQEFHGLLCFLLPPVSAFAAAKMRNAS